MWLLTFTAWLWSSFTKLWINSFHSSFPILLTHFYSFAFCHFRKYQQQHSNHCFRSCLKSSFYLLTWPYHLIFNQKIFSWFLEDVNKNAMLHTTYKHQYLNMLHCVLVRHPKLKWFLSEWQLLHLYSKIARITNFMPWSKGNICHRGCSVHHSKAFLPS